MTDLCQRGMMNKLFFAFDIFFSLLCSTDSDVKLTVHSSISLVHDWCMMSKTRRRKKKGES